VLVYIAKQHKGNAVESVVECGLLIAADRFCWIPHDADDLVVMTCKTATDCDDAQDSQRKPARWASRQSSALHANSVLHAVTASSA